MELFSGKSYNTTKETGKKPGNILQAMKIRLNEDEEIVNTIKKGLEAKGGYCPCKLGKSEDIKCMCKEFREQIADPNFYGYCHCRLYYKSK